MSVRQVSISRESSLMSIAMTEFSKYFTFENMTKSSRYPHLVELNREEAMPFMESGKKLSLLCEKIRLFLGVPLKETSGFRGVALSNAGGFSIRSAHTRFEALDVVPIGMSAKEAFAKIKENAHLFDDLRKVILERVRGKEWLHIEVKTKESDALAFYTTIDGKSFVRV